MVIARLIKEKLSSTFLKTVSAYANYGDGVIEFGITDEGSVVGVDDINKTCLTIENKINDSISPVPDYSITVDEERGVVSLKVFEGIFNIRGAVGDIVRSLQDVGERMPDAFGPHLAGDLYVELLFRIEEAHLLFFYVAGLRVHLQRRDRIFDDGVQKRVGQVHPVFVDQEVQLGHLAERLCVAFKMIQIGKHLFIQHPGDRFPVIHGLFQILGKPVPDSFLSEMSEGRIAYVMDETRALKDVADIRFCL